MPNIITTISELYYYLREAFGITDRAAAEELDAREDRPAYGSDWFDYLEPLTQDDVDEMVRRAAFKRGQDLYAAMRHSPACQGPDELAGWLAAQEAWDASPEGQAYAAEHQAEEVGGGHPLLAILPMVKLACQKAGAPSPQVHRTFGQPHAIGVTTAKGRTFTIELDEDMPKHRCWDLYNQWIETDEESITEELAS